MRTPLHAPYLLMGGYNSCRFQCPDVPAMNPGAAPFVVAVRYALDDHTPSTIVNLMTKSSAGGTGEEWYFRVETNGTLSFLPRNAAGTAIATFNSGTPTGFTNGTTNWSAVYFDPDNGAGACEATFFTATNATHHHLSAAYGVLGAQTAGTATTLYNSNNAVMVGQRITDDAALPAPTGKLFRAIWYPAAGATYCDFNPAHVTKTSTRQPSTYTDSVGNVWTQAIPPEGPAFPGDQATVRGTKWDWVVH